MTPMLFPSGAAPAAPDGIVSSAPAGAGQSALAGVPEATAGAVAVPEDSADFLAELLEVLEDLSLPAVAPDATGGQDDSMTTAGQSSLVDALASRPGVQTDALAESGTSTTASGSVHQAAAPPDDAPAVVTEDAERMSDEVNPALAYVPVIPLVQIEDVAPAEPRHVVDAAVEQETSDGRTGGTTQVESAPGVTRRETTRATAQGAKESSSSGTDHNSANPVVESAAPDGDMGPRLDRQTERASARLAAIPAPADTAQFEARPEHTAPTPEKAGGQSGASAEGEKTRPALAERLAVLAGREPAAPAPPEGAPSDAHGERLRQASNAHSAHAAVTRSAPPVPPVPPAAPPQVPVAPAPVADVTPGDRVESQAPAGKGAEQRTAGQEIEAGADHPHASEADASASLSAALDTREHARRGADGSREGRRHHTAEEWARRAVSLEARLAPPPGFTLTTADAALARPSLPPRAAEAFGVRMAFEMPQPAENLSRLVQSIRVQSRDGVSQANVRLNPEHLGEVTVTVRVEGSTVTAIVRAESADVRQWLRGQEESIRASLAGQGLELDDLVVDRDPSGQRESQEQQPAPPWRVPQRRRSGSAPQFEVSV